LSTIQADSVVISLASPAPGLKGGTPAAGEHASGRIPLRVAGGVAAELQGVNFTAMITVDGTVTPLT
jgi:hypothetical protein